MTAPKTARLAYVRRHKPHNAPYRRRYLLALGLVFLAAATAVAVGLLILGAALASIAINSP